ncbi:FkbM family methyltransferase [Astrocystis sublimbata]|nr:FkbM family methyltransferase [Astrocystis sublimbata]
MAHLIQFEKTSCYAQSEEEAKFIYKEIFEDGCYDVAGLPEAPFIVDAGANIGMFSLFVKQKFPAAKVLAFEPAPETYGLLRRNLELHGLADDVETLPCGLAARASTEKFTYFPNLPGNSTLKPEEKKQMVELARESRGDEVADQIFRGAQEFDVKLERLSDVLSRRPEFAAIDFLKVDVEGAELEVLRGLDDVHWGSVRNIVLETWDASGVRGEMEELLRAKGFTLKREEAPWSKGFWMISASREQLAT